MTQSSGEKRTLQVALGLGLLALLCAPTAAQEPLGQVEQVRSAGDSSGPIEQVSSGTREVMTPRATGALTPSVQQLSPAGEERTPPTQLGDAERDAAPPAQLYRGGPTAQPPQALSERSEGRTGAIAPVEGGEDACDPADEAQAKAKVCARVIETRSAEFVRPDPTLLSPEQRLIVQQRLREDPASRTEVTRRLAKEGDAATLEGLGVASMVLNQPASAPTDQPKNDPAENPAIDAAAAAILEIIGQGVSVTPPQ
ncbi:hypothetical protein [Sphingosinicella humi]|uniref:DUF3035 domain-containing protein n=1 Tax=Allosphingosinicella humi TaxID=2068657 RepID=A0A2U2J0P2_9SPHN|nr:hypothetical protein [Sphingosinicella humi]PWG01910.1 hypothetical protein DF286_02750 [Sphingosinicella humi]